MTPDTFLANFAHLADAPNGIRKLRELILQLAVQGKLVPQEPNDEPAGVLLTRIAAEKAKLVEEKKIRNVPGLPAPGDDEAPEAIPASWAWTRLSTIGIISPRNSVEDDTEVSFAPMATISEFYGQPVQPESRFWGEVKSGFTHFGEGDVVLAKITPCFQNGKSAVMRKLTNGLGAGTTELHVFRSIESTVHPEYVLLYLKSSRFLFEGEAKMTGSAGQKRVPKDFFANNPIPLPPLAEQERIVAKVDELMALSDELEAQQEQRNTSRTRLHKVSLDALTNADTPKAFTRHWNRIHDHFDLLHATPESIQALRQSILQLAVQGKLVPQDPNDEPAEALLEEAKRKKAMLRAGGKFGKAKPLAPIEDSGIASILPVGWISTRLGELVLSMTNGLYKPARFYTEDGTACVRMYNIQDGRLAFHKLQRVKLDADEQEKYGLVQDDLIVNRVNSVELVGKTAIIEELMEPMVYEAMNIRVRLVAGSAYPRYINLFMLGKNVRTEFQNGAKRASGQASISQPQVANLLLPLPPLAEQKRIVAKVEELMALCDALESKLNTAQSAQEELMTAIVRKLSAA